MKFSISLLFIYFGWGWCERCSDSLADTLRKGFNVTDGCEDCVILSPGITFEGRNWAGFCSGDKFFLFPDSKCREDNDLLNQTDCFVVGANELCELVEENHALNEECLKKFNSEICSEVSGLTDLDQGNVTEGVGEVSFYNLGQSEATEASLQRSHKNTPTAATVTSSREETSTQSPVTFTTSLHSTSTTITFSISPTVSKTYPPTTTNSYPSLEDCERNEFFFNDHCYFIRQHCSYYSEPKNISNFQDGKRKNFQSNSQIKLLYDVTKCCQKQHPRALGLAVQTKEENSFLLRLLKTSNEYINRIVLTSGIKWNSSKPGEWRDWNSEIDPSVLELKETIMTKIPHYYCINPEHGFWFLLPQQDPSDKEILTICERLYNPKNTLLELHRTCLNQYRKSPCYNSVEHTNFCCEKDDKGEIWFSCPNKTQKKVYPTGAECAWTCLKEGFFENDRPSCTGRLKCKGFYNGIEYDTTPTRHAISGCPRRHWGFSTWYCSSNATFVGTPDYSLCCVDRNLHCRNTDAFLNVWVGCPNKTSFRKITCPPGSAVTEALAGWYCDKTGNFSGSSPDYSNCSVTTCVQFDRFGRKWQALVDTTQEKDCPERFGGKCYWKCKKDGEFDGPEPDCTKCKAEWMERIEDKIKNDANHEEVMTIMENYTKTEDLRVGYGYVLNLTSDCVTLFKKQSPKSEINVFDKFLKSYSKILKNVAANPVFWSSFSVTNRGEYAKQVLNTTQSAAFAVLNSKNSSQQNYNATLAKSETDGFDFFVAYNLSKGSRFPLESSSESDWHLDVQKINESNPTLAAMGLVMNYTLSSLMFSNGIENEDLAMNAPAVTFTVAESADGMVAFDPNVVVSISFKHKSRTRYPQTQIIRRRMHVGVVGSTVCCYYRNSKWSTEGCFVTFTSKDRTSCTCNHLSTIGLLMTVHKYVPDATLEFLSAISSGITIISLILALLVFYFIDTVRNERVFIGKCLCFCLLIGHFLLLTVLDKKFFNIPDNLCIFYAVLLHYIFMAAFAWMFVEGCHLYRMLVLVFDSGIEYRRIYLVIGYGAPFVVVGVTAFVGFLSQEQPYGQDEFCWLKPPNYVWAFIGPVIVTTSINLWFLVTATKQAISSKQRFANSNSCASRIWLKGWISLSTLLGITWFFGLAYIHYNESLAYIFVVLNGLQGFFIFLFRCVLCEQYKNIFLKKMKSWFFSSESGDSKRSETVKSDTKLFVLSAWKSLSAETESKNSSCVTGIDGSDDRKDVNKSDKSSRRIRKTGSTSPRGSSEVDIDINITLTPATSKTCFKTSLTAKSFSLRKSKPTCMGDSDNFPELSYHNIYHSK